MSSYPCPDECGRAYQSVKAAMLCQCDGYAERYEADIEDVDVMDQQYMRQATRPAVRSRTVRAHPTNA